MVEVIGPPIEGWVKVRCGCLSKLGVSGIFMGLEGVIYDVLLMSDK